jgi:hypothetical protein
MMQVWYEDGDERLRRGMIDADKCMKPIFNSHTSVFISIMMKYDEILNVLQAGKNTNPHWVRERERSEWGEKKSDELK